MFEGMTDLFSGERDSFELSSHILDRFEGVRGTFSENSLDDN